MANLTQVEFLTIADQYPTEVNIWCTSENPVTVLGITIPFTDTQGNNVKNTLQQVQTITLPVDNDPNTTVELQILSRVIRGTTPNKYFFFKVQPKDISNYATPIENETIQLGTVVLQPSVNGISFQTSNYNILLNIAQDNRPSTYITQGTSNIPAQIQDSLYSDTGWSRGRYLGATTSRQNFASIDSAILGGSFEGSYFPSGSEDTDIAAIDTSERTYREYFHTDSKTYPEYIREAPALFSLFGAHDDTSTTLEVTPVLVNKPIKLYQPGDLLGTETQFNEVMKVLSMERTTSNRYNIEVIRGWNNTPKASYDNERGIVKIRGIRLFELSGNRPSPVRQGKIRIKETGYIVYIDRSGYVIGGNLPN